MVILGDTCDSSAIKEIGKGADILIHESTEAVTEKFDKLGVAYSAEKIEQLWREKEKKLIGKGHSSPRMAGKFAKEIKAKRLLLTHFSPRLNETIDIVVAEAAKSFENSNVEAGYDFLRVEI